MLQEEELDEGIDRITGAFGDRVLVPVAIPPTPLIGPRCRHLEPFSVMGYSDARQCPICGDKVGPEEVMLDSVALAIRRLVSAHPGSMAGNTTDRELAPLRRPAGGGPRRGVVVVYTEEGWSLPGGGDVFRFDDLATEDEALEWFNGLGSEELSELPGIGDATAMAMAAHMPAEGPLMALALQFIGPHKKALRQAFVAALRSFKLRRAAPVRGGEAGWAPTATTAAWPAPPNPRVPRPPAERVETAVVSTVYHHAAAAYSPGGAAVVAAIAARLYRQASPVAASMWIAACHADDTAAAVGVYARTWPNRAPSVAHFLEIIEPHLRAQGPEGCNTLAVVGYDPIATPPNQAIRRHNRIGSSRGNAEAAAAARMLARNAAVDAVQRIYGAAAAASTAACGATATTPTFGGSPAPPSLCPTPSTAPPRPPPPQSPLGRAAPTSPPAPRSTPSPPSATASPPSATTPPGCTGTPPPPSSSTAPGSC